MYQYPQPTPWWKKAFSFGELLIGLNLIFVDILLVSLLFPQYFLPFTKKLQPVSTTTNTITISPKPTIAITPLITVTSIPVQMPTIVQTSLVTDYYVPFGTGQSTATTWTNVPGLQAYINPASYPNIQQVVFEASIQVPTANQTAWVRLYDMSAQHEVWNSEMYFSGGANPQYLISQPVQLGNGNDLYQVQMQTQLGSPALLTQARLHITVK